MVWHFISTLSVTLCCIVNIVVPAPVSFMLGGSTDLEEGDLSFTNKDWVWLVLR